MNGGDSEERGKSTAPITRDLLGGCCTLNMKELDLDLRVPCGWEKRLDLKSGKVYLQRCNNSTSSSSSDKTTTKTLTTSFNHDLNFPPTPSKKALNLFNDDPDLKLVSSPSIYQSVCTIDKVKSALERTEKETTNVMKKRSSVISASPQLKNHPCDFDREEKLSGGGGGGGGGGAGAFAAGCPSCLLYVLISMNYPKCPRCNSNVPLPVLPKKPRIDLNISIM